MTKCILLNGFAAAGKTTIAKKYINDHPMALVIEGDELVVNIGQWTKNEPQARAQVFEFTKLLLTAHLARGYDVILPYLVTNTSHVEEFEKITQDNGAEFYEVLLHNSHDDAVGRLLQRGSWGEVGLPPVTQSDLPQIEKDLAHMENLLQERPNAKIIHTAGNSINETYAEFLKYIKDSAKKEK